MPLNESDGEFGGGLPLAEAEVRRAALNDQLGAELASYARPFGQYFASLLDEGCPTSAVDGHTEGLVGV